LKVVLQRVSQASVKVENEVLGRIEQGYVLLVGVGREDDLEDQDWLINKIFNLKLFPDESGQMSKSIVDVQGNVLVISQFTLFASIKKGTKPGFSLAAEPNIANEKYEQFLAAVKTKMPQVQSGQFGADMKVSLINDGPVTLILDSKNKV
jgi:D-tyrosyl-tRNA(Tyr) deacylase